MHAEAVAVAVASAMREMNVSAEPKAVISSWQPQPRMAVAMACTCACTVVLAKAWVEAVTVAQTKASSLLEVQSTIAAAVACMRTPNMSACMVDVVCCSS